jgi:benzoyl-CoA reductase/2-hydroxyglutaryl-CoA dehydratase subunit BcrC/BadD/HgdB
MLKEVIKMSTQQYWGDALEVIENQFVRQARDAGQKIVGYACLATPRELLEGAGLFPYRIKALGNPGTGLADAHLSRFNCRFCRSCLELVLQGSYDFLDGIIESNGCDQLRGMFEDWQHARPRSFFHYIRVPHLTDEDSLKWFTEELELLRAALSKHFAVTVGDKELAAAVKLREDIAQKLKTIYESRWGNDVKIAGSEMVSLIIMEGSLPAKTFIQFLNTFLQDLDARKPLTYKARLFMGGSATDEVALIAELERLGGLMVSDSFCFGSRRIFRQNTLTSGSPLSQLAKSYLNNLLCPRMFADYPRRKSYILEMLSKSRADGAIFFHNKFCDLHGVENVRIKLDLEKEGIPVLLLEKDYGAQADIGRLKTRVQAFLERLKVKGV